jgi:hypothetical protein
MVNQDGFAPKSALLVGVVFAFGIGIFCFTPPMHRRTAAIFLLLTLVVPGSLFASGKKEDKAAVSFHMETEGTDNPKMIFSQLAAGKERFFRRMPEIMIKDVVSFTPFPSEDGPGDYGMVFLLKENAAKRLAAITNVNQGKWMIAQVNGRVVDGVMIDKQVDDGRLVIWKGVTLGDIALFDEQLPRIGQEGQKKKK